MPRGTGGNDVCSLELSAPASREVRSCNTVTYDCSGRTDKKEAGSLLPVLDRTIQENIRQTRPARKRRAFSFLDGSGAIG